MRSNVRSGKSVRLYYRKPGSIPTRCSTWFDEGYAPDWFSSIRYVDWVGEHKDLIFVSDDISKVIIADDYPQYIKSTQKHRLIQIKEYIPPYSYEVPDVFDRELDRVIEKLKFFIS